MNFYNERQHKAKKDHRCDWCKGVIKKGDRYSYQVGKKHDFWYLKLHHKCAGQLKYTYYILNDDDDYSIKDLRDSYLESTKTQYWNS